MPNNFGLNGATGNKQTKFAPIYTPRWYSGIWTQRSPLRDATTTRVVEKYYGPAGDALIAGSNVEITNKLTLARRPGNSVYDANSYTSVDRFEEFRLFSPTTEEIIVMIDQANALYSLYNGTKSLVYTKSSGAGQTYMQSVGNTLYFGDGVDNKKWLQTLFTWSASTAVGTANSPFLTTFFIDSNKNIQQLTGTLINIGDVSVTGNVLEVITGNNIASLISVGDDVTFPTGMNASFLDGKTVTVTGFVGELAFSADFVNPNYSLTADTGKVAVCVGAGTPTTAATEPTWSTVVPSSSNNFQGGTTTDGTAQWTNRGPAIENWGIVGGTNPVSPAVGSSYSDSWVKYTYYSPAGVVIDSNGNLQQVVTAGTSGTTTPAWKTTVGQTTTDGTVTWKMIQTASSLVWQPNTAYTPAQQITSVAASSGSTAVYSGNIIGGASNALAGQTFLVSGFENDVNNGSFMCTASTIASLTLENSQAVAETRAAQASQEGTLQYVIGSASGTNCLFQVSPFSNPTLIGNVEAYLFSAAGTVGQFSLFNPTSVGTALASDTTLNSLSFTGTPLSTGATLVWNTVNGAGETVGTTTPFPSYNQNYQLIINFTLNVPVAGQYAFSIRHHDGMIWGIGNGAVGISGTTNNPSGQVVTAANGYTVLGGTNIGLEGGQVSTDTFIVNFPTAGEYPGEINYAYWYHSGQILDVQSNGLELPNGAPQSGTTQPTWPAFTVTNAPNYATVAEVGGSIAWSNIGPTTDFAWQASIGFTLPNTTIIDTNGSIEAPFRTGVTGATAPTWQVGTYDLTYDAPNLIWINEGQATAVPSGTVSTYNGGWIYCVALVNTLDDTVSNASPVSAATGNFVGANGVTIPAGAGLPAKIDPQSDWVAVYRSTDGEATPFLIPGPNSIQATIPLSEYLVNGYVDSTPDTGLNNLIEGAIAQQNTPPAAGAKNLAYYLNRIFYSIGNTVYWTSGADTPAGNGVNGTSPLNFDSFPSLVKRIVPTTSGAIIFTVSDIYIIQSSSSTIQAGIPLIQGIGLLNYNALDVHGSVIGLFTTDSEFILLDPNAGVTTAGFPIGDQLGLNNGTIGQSWNPANVYVAWHTSGQDSGWYVCDGVNGWYRMLATPAPESGYTWCPYATIQGGVKALQSIEVTPGVHKLLLGPTATGPILCRNLSYFLDNTTPYTANATIGSCVLAQPGQVAVIDFITTESTNVGTPLTLGILVDEALPFWKGPFDPLNYWVNDPPSLKPSKSLLSQRFYFSELQEAAACRHIQVQIQWIDDQVQNELQTMTVFGGYFQEN